MTDSLFVNADPSYQCSTINAIPATESILKKSRLPLALVLAPYRTSKEGDVSFFWVIFFMNISLIF